MKKIATKVGILLVIGMVLLAITAPFVAPYDPSEYNLDRKFEGPSLSHPFGMDENGRDIISRVIFGARVSMAVGVLVVLITGTVGTLIGLFVGYFGGHYDTGFNFVSNVFLAFPGILLAIAMAAFQRHQSIINVMLILSVVGWVEFARLVRGEVLRLRRMEFVEAARSVGVSPRGIFLRHLLPNISGPLIVNATFGVAGVILAESTLSFLGLGAPVTTPTWGAMLDSGTQFILIAPHLSIFPGIAIMLVVLGFNFMGDGLRDKFAGR